VEFANRFAGRLKPRAVAILMAILVAAATAVLLWFGNGLDPWWPLMWFAPLPVLWFALRRSWWVAGLTAAAGWLAGCFNLWGYFRLLGMPFAAWLSIFGAVALVAAAAVLLFRALVLRGAVWSGLLAFPAAWVAMEWLRNLTTPHGTAGSIAYTQLKFLPFLQLASITGPWGMSFLLLCFPAALAIGLHLRNSPQKQAPRQALRVVVATLAVLAAVLVFGTIRLVMTPRGQQVRVGLVASDTLENVNVAGDGADRGRLFASYAVEAERLAAPHDGQGGAQAIVLPEKLAAVLDSENGTADPIFQELADRTGATIVVGEVHIAGSTKDRPAKYNQARIYQPKEPVLSYDKEHMLPPFESNLTPGTALVTLPKHARASGAMVPQTALQTAPQTWGVAICKDLDFTPLSRKYGKAGAGLMLVPGWDFNVDRGWHGHIAVMRGVEDGFSLVRAAKDGYLTVSDNRGRVVAEARSDAAPFATLLASVPAVHSATVYLLLGDWFAWMACALLVLAIVQLCRVAMSARAPRQSAGRVAVAVK
jgi:apolipoprotein N-acyltransferase